MTEILRQLWPETRPPSKRVRRFAGAVLSTLLMTGFAGCTTGTFKDDQPPRIPSRGSTRSPGPQPSESSGETPEPSKKPKDEARNTKDLNIIYLGTNLGTPKDGIAEAIRSNDQTVTEAVDQAVFDATHGYHDPDAVNVTVAEEELDLGKCIETIGSDSDIDAIEEAAKQYEVVGNTNVVVVEGDTCVNDDGEKGPLGFDTPDTMPVLTLETLKNIELFDGVLIHETGHDAGLEHAGDAYCKNPITISGCSIDRDTDASSPMSKLAIEAVEQGGNLPSFTWPEMYKMGYTDNDEVIINPSAGKYELSEYGLGTKVMIFNGMANGEDSKIYISYQDDPNNPGEPAIQIRWDHESKTPDSTGSTESLVLINRQIKPGAVLMEKSQGWKVVYRGKKGADAVIEVVGA